MSGRRPTPEPEPTSAASGTAPQADDTTDPASTSTAPKAKAAKAAKAKGAKDAKGGKPAPPPEPDRLRPPVERPPDEHLGQGIVTASWIGTGLFAAVSIPAALAPDTFAPFLIVVSLVLFLAGTVVFALAFLTAVGRSREVLIGMGGLFFVAGGTAPLRISRHLMGSFAAECVLAVATTVLGLFTVPADVTNPVAFGVLVPIYGLGLAGLWSARYGHFADRPPEPAERRRRSTS